MLKVSKFDQDGVAVDVDFVNDAPKFRESLFETCLAIRANTNKDIVIPLSGGSDSMLVKWVFDQLGIKTRTIHQRYYHDNQLINKSESQYVEDADIYQDINVVDFEHSDWYQSKFVNFVPIPVHLALQSYVDVVLNPETDYVVVCGTPPGIYKFKYDSEPVYAWVSTLGSRSIGLSRYEWCSIFNHDKYIGSSWFDSLFKNQVTKVKKGVWENQFKKQFYDFHFPEIDHLQKTWIPTWSYFKQLTIERTRGIYMQSGEELDVYAQRTRLTLPLDQVYNGYSGRLEMAWVKDLDTYEGFV